MSAPVGTLNFRSPLPKPTVALAPLAVNSSLDTVVVSPLLAKPVTSAHLPAFASVLSTHFRLKPKSELAACPCTTFVTLTSEAGKVT